MTSLQSDWKEMEINIFQRMRASRGTELTITLKTRTETAKMLLIKKKSIENNLESSLHENNLCYTS